MSIKQLHGAWRIEEAPRRRKRDHAYGFPNTHWIIVGDRGLVIRDLVPQPFAFDFRIHIDTKTAPQECGIWGDHGGSGYCEIDDDFLFIGLGLHGGRPPRFAIDCGNFFALQRDPDFPMPTVPAWPRDEITSSTLGRLAWNQREPEYMGDWIGKVALPDGTDCEIWAGDYLIPIRQFLPKIESTYRWLLKHLTEVKLIGGEKVAEWVDEDDDYSQLTVEQVADTISVNVIEATNGDIYLWAATSIPIDHAIRIWLEFSDDSIRATGASIEG